MPDFVSSPDISFVFKFHGFGELCCCMGYGKINQVFHIQQAFEDVFVIFIPLPVILARLLCPFAKNVLLWV